MKRILVAYATKNGSTAEIAQAIAHELRYHDLEVDCLDARTVKDLEPYGAVVLGSAVYAGRWRRSARAFLHRHRAALPTMPWWVFSSGPIGKSVADDPKAAAWLEPPKIMAVVEDLGVRGHVVFGGRLPLVPKNFVERAMVRNTPPELADLRDWDQISAWAAEIASDLEAVPEPTPGEALVSAPG
jgi:menaquinone-dependent protoporphyrinogen oxidase